MGEIDIIVAAGKVQVIPVLSPAADVQLIAGPCNLHGYSLRDATGVAGVGNVPIATGSAAAAGSGSAALPVNDSMSQFTLSFGNVTGANTLAVTVTNAQGGTLTYAIPLAVGQNSPFVATFPTPLEAVAASAINVNVTGNVNSPTVSITAYGVASLTSSVAEIRDGNNPLAEVSLPPTETDTRWYGDTGVWVRNEILFHPISGVMTGAVYASYARHTG